jgi:hypothetical protein
MTCCETRLQGPWQVFQLFVLPPKFFANLAVTFFGFAAVLSTCCCAWHVKEVVVYRNFKEHVMPNI